MLHAAHVTAVLVNTQPDHWKDGLTAAETEVRRAVAYGVRPDELAREIGEEDALFKAAAAGAATRRTPALADELVGALGDNEVDTSPADDLAFFETITKTLSADTVSAALKAAFDANGPLVFVGSAKPVEGGARAMRVAYEHAKAQPVTAPAKLRDQGRLANTRASARPARSPNARRSATSTPCSCASTTACG